MDTPRPRSPAAPLAAAASPPAALAPPAAPGAAPGAAPDAAPGAAVAEVPVEAAADAHGSNVTEAEEADGSNVTEAEEAAAPAEEEDPAKSAARAELAALEARVAEADTEWRKKQEQYDKAPNPLVPPPRVQLVREGGTRRVHLVREGGGGV